MADPLALHYYVSHEVLRITHRQLPESDAVQKRLCCFSMSFQFVIEILHPKKGKSTIDSQHYGRFNDLKDAANVYQKKHPVKAQWRQFAGGRLQLVSYGPKV